MHAGLGYPRQRSLRSESRVERLGVRDDVGLEQLVRVRGIGRCAHQACPSSGQIKTLDDLNPVAALVFGPMLSSAVATLVRPTERRPSETVATRCVCEPRTASFSSLDLLTAVDTHCLRKGQHPEPAEMCPGPKPRRERVGLSGMTRAVTPRDLGNARSRLRGGPPHHGRRNECLAKGTVVSSSTCSGTKSVSVVVHAESGIRALWFCVVFGI